MYIKLREQAERVRAVDTAGVGAKLIVSALQEACDKIDGDRDWSFTYRTFVVTSAAGDQPQLPTDFAQWGINGGVSLWLNAAGTGRKKPLQYLSMWRYYRMRDLGRTGPPESYAPGEGVNLSTTRFFFLEPEPDQSVTMDVMARRKFPRFTFSFADPNAPITNPNVLLQIPDHWHDTVVYEWAMLYLMRNKANVQAQGIQKAIAEDALKSMRTNERNGREAIHHLAPYGGGIIYPA